jgi:hypothetical protein
MHSLIVRPKGEIACKGVVGFVVSHPKRKGRALDGALGGFDRSRLDVGKIGRVDGTEVGLGRRAGGLNRRQTGPIRVIVGKSTLHRADEKVHDSLYSKSYILEHDFSPKRPIIFDYQSKKNIVLLVVPRSDLAT